MKWIRYEPKAQMRVLNHIYPEGIHIPDYFFGKNIVQLPTMKCHIYTTTTGAMKNAFGGLLNTRRHYTHSWIHETLVDLLQIQYEIHSGLFAVMDGTTAGNGPGPRTLQPVNANYLLASADQVARCGCRQNDKFEHESPYIRIAHEEGLGIGKPGSLSLVTFRVNRTLPLETLRQHGDVLVYPLKRFQKLFFHTPLVGLFVWHRIYHDKSGGIRRVLKLPAVVAGIAKDYGPLLSKGQGLERHTEPNRICLSNLITRPCLSFLPLLIFGFICACIYHSLHLFQYEDFYS